MDLKTVERLTLVPSKGKPWTMKNFSLKLSKISHQKAPKGFSPAVKRNPQCLFSPWAKWTCTLVLACGQNWRGGCGPLFVMLCADLSGIAVICATCHRLFIPMVCTSLNQCIGWSRFRRSWTNNHKTAHIANFAKLMTQDSVANFPGGSRRLKDNAGNVPPSTVAPGSLELRW